MKLLIALSLLVAGYMYVLTHTTNIVLLQTAQLQSRYQSVAADSESMFNQ